MKTTVIFSITIILLFFVTLNLFIERKNYKEYNVLVKLHLDSAEVFNNQHKKIGSYTLPNHSPFGELCAKDNE